MDNKKTGFSSTLAEAAYFLRSVRRDSASAVYTNGTAWAAESGCLCELAYQLCQVIEEHLLPEEVTTPLAAALEKKMRTLANEAKQPLDLAWSSVFLRIKERLVSEQDFEQAAKTRDAIEHLRGLVENGPKGGNLDAIVTKPK